MAAKSVMTTDELFSRIAAELRISKSLVRRLFEELTRTAIRETKTKGVFVLPGVGRLVKTCLLYTSQQRKEQHGVQRIFRPPLQPYILRQSRKRDRPERSHRSSTRAASRAR